MPNPDIHGGAPGLGSTRETDFRRVFLGNEKFLAGSFVIDGANARDPLNTNRVFEIRAGLLLGRLSASNKFGASIIGVSDAEAASEQADISVSTKVAEEVERRVGTGSNIKITGPPSAGGTVATETKEVSSIDTSAGTITVDTNLSNTYIAGSFIRPDDGSEEPLTILYDGYPKRVIDADLDDRDVDLGRYPVGGVVESTQILNWPSDSALQQWIIDELNKVGNFVFDSQHGL